MIQNYVKHQTLLSGLPVLLDVAHYLGEVDHRLAGIHPKTLGGAHFMGRTGSANQCLGAA